MSLRSRDATVRQARASFAARYRDETAFDLGEQIWWKRAVVAGFAIDGPQVRELDPICGTTGRWI